MKRYYIYSEQYANQTNFKYKEIIYKLEFTQL